MASKVQWREPSRRDSDMSTAWTAGTDHASYTTYSTAITNSSNRFTPKRQETSSFPIEGYYEYQFEPEPFDLDYEEQDDARSISTYASTTSSDEEEEHLMGTVEDDYEIPDCLSECYTSEAIPSTPQDFADYFPSRRRMSIRHDDSTVDGNMNLRIDTDIITRSGRKRPLTLFHLRMHDLKTRDFSLRRYCRDSGREVCHSARKYEVPVARPTLQKSFSSVLASFMKESKQFVPTALARSDSGYGSLHESHNLDSTTSPTTGALQAGASRKASRLPTNTIKLEFSNYAQLEIKRRGAGSKKRYDFEYWGQSYHWRRDVTSKGRFEEASFHLIRSDRSRPIAHVVPQSLTFGQAREERLKGGWVTPCSLWISDESVLNGAADVAE